MMAASVTDTATDESFMAAALTLGRRYMGQTWPNPAVGALVVRDGQIVGRGMTKPSGRPHAETEALQEAGDLARGATLYVTLEPCSHHGLTPPCADAVVAAGITRVVSALEDPDARVAGRGHARMAAAGIDVVTGTLQAEAHRAHLGHILRVTQGRPMLTLKLAETADGYAAGGDHDPRLMITGLAANNRVQMWRAFHDAVMIGVGTAHADDPLLTVRLPGLERKPWRIVLDTKLSLSLRSRLVSTAQDWPVLVICGEAAPKDAETALIKAGVHVTRVAIAADGHLDLAAALGALAARGLTRIFSEGGPTVASHLVRQDLADEVVIVRAPRPLLRPGVPSLQDAARVALADQNHWRPYDVEAAGIDQILRYERVGACLPVL